MISLSRLLSRRLFFTAFTALLAALAGPVAAGILTGPVTNPVTGHTYYLLTQNTWTASEAAAVALGGHLVTINDSAENDWVLNTFSRFGGSAKTLWIGLHDSGTDGTFAWTSGQSADFRNWAAGEPSAGSAGEDYAHLYELDRGAASAGKWNVTTDQTTESGVPLHGVVEMPLVVANVRAAQRAGTNLVDIDFDVTGITKPVTVTLEVSGDNGTTFTVPGTSLTGAVGSQIIPAANLRITWDGGGDWAGHVVAQPRFRISADDNPVPVPPGFALIPAGPFQMGDQSSPLVGFSIELPVHTVQVSAFYMGKYEVTGEEWDVVRTWGLANGYTDLPEGFWNGANYPVHMISWYDMVKWCNAWSQKEGLTPCYTVSGATHKTGNSAPVCNWNANGYRLPTEAEWEKAARGGVAGKNFPWGTDTITPSQANYNPAIFGDPYPVGSFAPNGYGLYDMAGNLCERCWEWFGNYPAGPQLDPRGPAAGDYRIFRGGSWFLDAFYCRAACRGGWDYPGDAYDDTGFRVALGSVPYVASAVSSATPLDFRTGLLTVKPADLPKTIADNALAASSLTVAGFAGPIADVNVSLDISHPNTGDLTLRLVSPQGTRVLLAAKQGGTGDNFTTTVFDDEATTPITSGTAPFTGSFRPADPLLGFDGEDPNGAWTLEILDDTTGNTGTLTGWSLRFTIGSAPAALTVTTHTPLADWPVGVAYSRPLTALGGTPPYTWAVVAGALPPPLVLNPVTGIITGTPATGGLSIFRVRATDAASHTATKDLSLTIRRDSAALTVGTRSGGMISPAGETDELTFFARAGQTLTVVVNPAASGAGAAPPPVLGRVRAELRNPAGTLMTSSENTAAGQVLVLENIAIPADGTHTLRIKAPAAASTATGNYTVTVTVWDATPDTAALAFNSQLIGKVDNPYNIDRWTFSAVAGQQVRFRLLSPPNIGTGFSLAGPAAWTGFTDLIAGSNLITLPTTGSYTLTARSLGGAYGTGYSFRLDETSQAPITAGTPLTGRFNASGQAQIFALTVAENMPLLLQLANAGAGNQVEIYAKFGAPPTRGDFDSKFGTPASSNQQILVPNAVAGTWYVLVYGDYIPTPGDFTLTATLQKVFLTGVTPDRTGNSAEVVLTLTGAGFDQQTAVSLVATSGAAYPAGAVAAAGGASLNATFAAGTVPAGRYSVRAVATGGDAAELASAVEILNGGNPRFEHKIVMPGSVGYNRPATVYVDFSNTGTVAMPAPLLKVSITQNGTEGAFLTLDSELFAKGFWTASVATGFRHSVQILASGAIPGLLQPGEAIRVPVYYAGWQTPWDFSRSPMNFAVSVVFAEDPTPVAWASAFTAPAGMSAADWQVVLDNVSDNLGTTWGDYVSALGETATALVGYGNDNVRDADYLQGITLARAGEVAQAVTPPPTGGPGAPLPPEDPARAPPEDPNAMAPDPYEPGTVLYYSGGGWVPAIVSGAGLSVDPARKTVVIIHGCNNQVDAPNTWWVTQMASRILLAEGGNANILAVDWGRFAHPPWLNLAVPGWKDAYPPAVFKDHSYVPEVAVKAARRLFGSAAVGGLGLLPDTTHIIGHSAGGHIAQMIGIYARYPWPCLWAWLAPSPAYGTVGKITLLDPSPDSVQSSVETWTFERLYYHKIARFIDCYKSSESFSGYTDWGNDNFILSKGDIVSGSNSLLQGSPLGKPWGSLYPPEAYNPKFMEQLGRHEDAHDWYLLTIHPGPSDQNPAGGPFGLGYWWDSNSWTNATGKVINYHGRANRSGNGGWLGIIDENTQTICGLSTGTGIEPVSGQKYNSWEYPGVWPGSHSLPSLLPDWLPPKEQTQVVAMIADLQRTVELYVVPESSVIPQQWQADQAQNITFAIRNNDTAAIYPLLTSDAAKDLLKVPYQVWLAKTGDSQLTGQKKLLDSGDVDLWSLKATYPMFVRDKIIKMPSKSDVTPLLDANKQALLVIEINPAQGSRLLELYQANNRYAKLITVDGQGPVTADAGPDQSFEDVTTDSMTVTLDGRNSGPDDQIVAGSYVWTEDGQVIAQGRDTFSKSFAVGKHEITLTITDLQGNPHSDRTQVSITKRFEPPRQPGDSGTQRPIQSWDPNALTGPTGYGPANHLSVNLGLPYRIDFENDSSASAPAQQVTVTNPLSNNLDWSSFRLAEIGFGDQLIVLPPGTQYYQNAVPMTYNGVTFEVRIEAGIHSATGQVFANFQSLDPATNLPPEALTGFLPPEDGTGRGMGHVSYSVKPKAGSLSGIAIRNIALIVFDGQSAIATNQIDPHNPGAGTDPNKEALVTLDDGPPTVTLTATPIGVGGTNIDVRWVGNDRGGVGIKSFDVEVSLNNGAYQPWLTNTPQTQATYPGYFGQQLQFRVSTSDFLGQQAQPATATTVIIDDDYLHWRAAIFGNAVGDPALRNALWGDDADSDGDGRSNVLEFLAATNPLVADAQFDPTTRTEGGDLIYRYRLTKVANHLVDHFLEWSPDGVHWFTGGLVFRVVEEHADYRLMEAVLTLNGQTGVQIRQVVEREVIFNHWVYEEGVAFENRSPEQDPNGDGIPNGLAYALGLPAMGAIPPADAGRVPRMVVDETAPDPADHRGGIEFGLPLNPAADVILIVEASVTGAPGSWSEVVRRSPGGGWLVNDGGGWRPPDGKAVRVVSQAGPAWVRTTITEKLVPGRLYRVRAVIAQ